MICPECNTDCADGADTRFIEAMGRCYACDFERYLDERIRHIKGEESDDTGNSVDDQTDV